MRAAERYTDLARSKKSSDMSTNKTWLAAFATLMLAAVAFAADFLSYLKMDGTKRRRVSCMVCGKQHSSRGKATPSKQQAKRANAIPLPTAK